MATNELLGLVLIAVGVTEPLVGLWIAGRQANPASARVLKLAMLASGVVMAGVGVAVYTGRIAVG